MGTKTCGTRCGQELTGRTLAMLTAEYRMTVDDDGNGRVTFTAEHGSDINQLVHLLRHDGYVLERDGRGSATVTL